MLRDSNHVYPLRISPSTHRGCARRRAECPAPPRGPRDFGLIACRSRCGLSGRLTAPEFFNGLKRIDRADAGTVFVRGNQVVTQFPDELRLQFVVFDFPCNIGEKSSPEHKLLTREDVSSLHLALYWKRGVDLRPADHVTMAGFSIEPLVPPEIAHERHLQERLEWTYVFQVPSRGVPLTDSLVLVIRNREGRIAARVAARL